MQKSSFQELKKSWQIYKPNFPIIPDMWQNLTYGYYPQGVECIRSFDCLSEKLAGLYWNTIWF
jgi:hypothetical protein